MDTRRVIFNNEDGTCSVVAGFYRSNNKGDLFNLPIEEIILTGSPKLRTLMIDGEGFKEAFERIGEAVLKLEHEYTICSVTDLPSDREFRGAWEYRDSSININMSKACDIHMDKIKLVRNEKLKELDIETMKGLDVQPEKQVLRDLPESVDLSTATTPEELKAIWPTELK